MDGEHWLFLLAVALGMGLLACFSLEARPNGRLYRWARRVFWAGAALYLGGMMGGVPLNGLSLAVTAMLGAPGYGALLWIVR